MGLRQEGHLTVKVYASILNESCVRYGRVISTGYFRIG